MTAALAGCASGPRYSADRDGPEANPPPDLVRVPDAEPKIEPIRPGGANKPYDVLGHSYVPITQDAPYTERGLASWYGRKFQGKRTSSGELYNMYAMTAAHPTLPIPSYARIRNPANGREVVVRINDRGPFHSTRIVDLSYTAALKLDVLRGVTPVELERITFDDIRTGAWRREQPPGPANGPAQTLLAQAAVATDAVPVPTPTTAIAPTAAETPGASLPASPAVTPASASASAPSPLPATATSAPTSAPVSTPSSSPAPPTTLPPMAAGATAASATVVAAPIADAPADRAYTAPARGYWVQLGAYRQRDGAEAFHRRVVSELDWLSPLLAVFSDAAIFRLQAGPYPSRDEARAAAQRIRDGLQLVPVIVERR